MMIILVFCWYSRYTVSTLTSPYHVSPTYTWPPKLAGVLQNVLNNFMSPNLILFDCFIAFKFFYSAKVFLPLLGRKGREGRQATVVTRKTVLLRTLLKVRATFDGSLSVRSFTFPSLPTAFIFLPFFFKKKSVLANYSLQQKVGRSRSKIIHL